MKLLFACEIPGRVAIKKNSTQRKYSFAKKRTFTMPSDRYLEWQKMAVDHVRQEWLDAKREQISEEVFAKFYFHFKNHQSEPDTSNCIEGPADVLTKAGVITDDRLIVALYAQKEFGLDAKTIIELYEAKEVMGGK